jgi:t-SNARE complex subunit (syntaxin)
MSESDYSPEEREETKAKFKRLFIGVILFIVFVVVVLLSTGRGFLA